MKNTNKSLNKMKQLTISGGAKCSGRDIEFLLL
jgi:hypothetical protein